MRLSEGKFDLAEFQQGAIKTMSISNLSASNSWITFSLVWKTETDDFEKSSGVASEILDGDFHYSLSDENKRILERFVETAKVGESIIIDDILVLREDDDFEIDWEPVTIPAAAFPAELKAKMTSPRRVETV
jgi:hypothetical protein